MHENRIDIPGLSEPDGLSCPDDQELNAKANVLFDGRQQDV